MVNLGKREVSERPGVSDGAAVWEISILAIVSQRPAVSAGASLLAVAPSGSLRGDRASETGVLSRGDRFSQSSPGDLRSLRERLTSPSQLERLSP